MPRKIIVVVRPSILFYAMGKLSWLQTWSILYRLSPHSVDCGGPARSRLGSG